MRAEEREQRRIAAAESREHADYGTLRRRDDELDAAIHRLEEGVNTRIATLVGRIDGLELLEPRLVVVEALRSRLIAVEALGPRLVAVEALGPRLDRVERRLSILENPRPVDGQEPEHAGVGDPSLVPLPDSAPSPPSPPPPPQDDGGHTTSSI